MSTLMRNTGSLMLEPEQELTTSAPRTVTTFDPVAEKAALLAAGYSGVEGHSTPFHAFLEHSTTILFPVVLVASLYFTLSQLHELELLWLVFLAIPISLVLGDLVSGLVHWTADTYFLKNLQSSVKAW